MLIKGAESFLKKENQIQRQESRVILNEIEKCFKVMTNNNQQFQLFYGSHVKIIGEVFLQLHK
jgi:phosphotransferase system IIB component